MHASPSPSATSVSSSGGTAVTVPEGGPLVAYLEDILKHFVVMNRPVLTDRDFAALPEGHVVPNAETDDSDTANDAWQRLRRRLLGDGH